MQAGSAPLAQRWWAKVVGTFSWLGFRWQSHLNNFIIFLFSSSSCSCLYLLVPPLSWGHRGLLYKLSRPSFQSQTGHDQWWFVTSSHGRSVQVLIRRWLLALQSVSLPSLSNPHTSQDGCLYQFHYTHAHTHTLLKWKLPYYRHCPMCQLDIFQYLITLFYVTTKYHPAIKLFRMYLLFNYKWLLVMFNMFHSQNTSKNVLSQKYTKKYCKTLYIFPCYSCFERKTCSYI